MLFGKVVESFGGGVSLKEAGHWRRAIRPYSPTHFLFTFSFLRADKIGAGNFLLLPRLLRHDGLRLPGTVS